MVLAWVIVRHGLEFGHWLWFWHVLWFWHGLLSGMARVQAWVNVQAWVMVQTWVGVPARVRVQAWDRGQAEPSGPRYGRAVRQLVTSRMKPIDQVWGKTHEVSISCGLLCVIPPPRFPLPFGRISFVESVEFPLRKVHKFGPSCRNRSVFDRFNKTKSNLTPY